MAAFEQRKSRQEQRKYAKELSSNKQAEKSKRKREGLEDIEQWKKGAKRNRSARARVCKIHKIVHNRAIRPSF